MIPATLLQTQPRLTEIQKSVHDHFTEGGSFTETVYVLLVLVLALAIVLFLGLIGRVAERRSRARDPKQVYRDLLGKLNLTPQQRALLKAVARDLRLKDPTVMLLSPPQFDRHMHEWQVRQLDVDSDKRFPRRGQLAAQVRRVLFL